MYPSVRVTGQMVIVGYHYKRIPLIVHYLLKDMQHQRILMKRLKKNKIIY